MGKLWQFADMIIQDIRTFYGVYQKEYDDKVVNATLDKLEIDLEAIVKEYYKASEIVQIIPQVDLPASFVRVEEHPTMGEGWYTAKFTCPGCQKEMTVLGNCAASCECSIWRVDIKSNRALRIDRSPLGLV